MQWKNIQINKQNIKGETSKSVLIKMPHNSDYDGYCFWHPKKLIHEGAHSNALSLGYTSEFEFRVIKYGNGKWNSKEIIDEYEISVEEFEEAFNVMSENIKGKTIINIYETHKPEELVPEKAKIIEELKD